MVKIVYAQIYSVGELFRRASIRAMVTSTTQVVEEAQCRLAAHTLWLEQLYFCNLFVVFVELYNATHILHQWRHLALNSELPSRGFVRKQS